MSGLLRRLVVPARLSRPSAICRTSTKHVPRFHARFHSTKTTKDTIRIYGDVERVPTEDIRESILQLKEDNLPILKTTWGKLFKNESTRKEFLPLFKDCFRESDFDTPHKVQRLLNSMKTDKTGDTFVQLFEFFLSRGVPMDIRNYNTFLVFFVKEKIHPSKIVNLLETMKEKDIAPTSFTSNWVWNAAIAQKDISFTDEFYNRFPDFESSGFRESRLLGLAAKEGDVGRMLEIARHAETAHVYNKVLKFFNRRQQFESSEEFFRMMLQKGIKPDKFTYNLMIEVSSAMRRDSEAKTMFEQAIANNEYDEELFRTYLRHLAHRSSPEFLLVLKLFREKNFQYSRLIMMTVVQYFDIIGEYERASEIAETLDRNVTDWMDVLKRLGLP